MQIHKADKIENKKVDTREIPNQSQVEVNVSRKASVANATEDASNKVIATPKDKVESKISEPAKVKATEKVNAKVAEEDKVDEEQKKDEQIVDQPIIEKSNQVAWNHQVWDDILQKHVTASGKVDYAGIKAKPAGLESYIKDLAGMTPSSDWSANKEKAYWINVYNAFTVKMIVDNYPVNSITDLHGGKPWDVSWIKLGSKTYSLNDVEHKILRPKFNDARIHFAVNCAAKSCPKIWNRAWTEQNIEGALDKLTKEFVNNSALNQINENQVNVSKIFDWYKEDFGDLIAFLNKYTKTKISSNAKIAFNDYNWKLNS